MDSPGHRPIKQLGQLFDAPVPGNGTPVMFTNRWHHGLHWELDLPKALTAEREELYLGFFYRHWGARPDAIAEEAQHEYLRTYRQPGSMRAGFNLYRATPQDVADNEAFLAHGKLQMPVLCYGGPHGRGRGVAAIESCRRVAADVRGGIADHCGHWIPEERPDWTVQQLPAFFNEDWLSSFSLRREPVPEVATFPHSVGYQSVRRTATLGPMTMPVQGMMDKSMNLAMRYFRTAPLARANEVIE